MKGEKGNKGMCRLMRFWQCCVFDKWQTEWVNWKETEETRAIGVIGTKVCWWMINPRGLARTVIWALGNEEKINSERGNVQSNWAGECANQAWSTELVHKHVCLQHNKQRTPIVRAANRQFFSSSFDHLRGARGRNAPTRTERSRSVWARQRQR